MNCTDDFREKDYYKEKIIELIGKIENPWILEQILRVVINIMKED